MTRSSEAPVLESSSIRHSRAWLLLLLLLALANAIAFSPAFHASFITLDDGLYVFTNPHVREGFSTANIYWALTTRNGGFWIPLTWLSFQCDATLSLLFQSPAVVDPPAPFIPSAAFYHADNIFLHVLAACFLFLALRRATGRTGPSFIAALLWSIHPLRTESVAWVTERKDVLSGCFACLAIYFHADWAHRRSEPRSLLRYAAVGVFAAASLLAKPMTVTLPAVLLLLDYWPLGRLKTPRDLASRLYEKLPLFLLSVLDSIGTYLAQRRIGTLPIGPLERAANALTSYGRYLWMHVDFSRLAVFYPYTPPPVWALTLSILVLLTMTILCFRLRRRYPHLLVGWLWYVGAFLPMIGFVQSGGQAYADRFTYFPTIGLAVMLAYSIPASWFQLARIVWLASSALALSALLGFYTFQQTLYWKDPVTLFSRALQVTPDNPTAHLSLAHGYLRAGKFELALAEFNRIPHPDPEANPPLEVDIATTLNFLDRPQEAIACLQRAAERQPNCPEIYEPLGEANLKLHTWNDAIDAFQKKLQFTPGDPAATQNLAYARRQAGLE
jgi:tetratricopeptide (TPR) repeat protein